MGFLCLSLFPISAALLPLLTRWQWETLRRSPMGSISQQTWSFYLPGQLSWMYVNLGFCWTEVLKHIICHFKNQQATGWDCTSSSLTSCYIIYNIVFKRLVHTTLILISITQMRRKISISIAIVFPPIFRMKYCRFLSNFPFRHWQNLILCSLNLYHSVIMIMFINLILASC